MIDAMSKRWVNLDRMHRLALIVFGVALLIMIVHGTLTRRANHQMAFARGVAKKIAIENIYAYAESGTLVLVGQGSKRQSDYAEKVAMAFMQKYSDRAVNPPTKIRNEIQVISRSGLLKAVKKKTTKPAKNQKVSSAKKAVRVAKRVPASVKVKAQAVKAGSRAGTIARNK